VPHGGELVVRRRLDELAQPMVQGTVLVAALAIVVMNLVVDVLYAFLDPRVRYLAHVRD